MDTIGNVYLTDCDPTHSRSNRVLKLPTGSNTAIELPFTGLKNPKDVAVDTAATSTSPMATSS